MQKMRLFLVPVYQCAMQGLIYQSSLYEEVRLLSSNRLPSQATLESRVAPRNACFGGFNMPLYT